MMPGNASGLGMGKDDYLTERILGINLSLTRMRERDGFGKAGTITCSKFFFIPKLEGDSEERVSTCGHVNAYYRMQNHALIMQYQMEVHFCIFWHIHKMQILMEIFTNELAKLPIVAIVFTRSL